MFNQPQIEGNILIVDDVLNNVRLLSDMLTQEGYKVRQAINGSMALMTVTASPPDLILLDINMPGIDGYEVCQRLKSQDTTKDIPIIFLSALHDIDDKIKSFELGAVDYITKPFHRQEVLKRVQNQLSVSSLTRQLETQNEILKETLVSLKEKQAEIIQHEKMSGLNHLIAGVAHEINNPISFIFCNLKYAESYFQAMRQAILEENQDRQIVGSIEKSEEVEDLEFALEDFPNVLRSMSVGTKRIIEIVQALQTFAHHKEEGVKAINLHQTLDSILILLQTHLQQQDKRPAIAVYCEYGDIPPVICDVKLIGQVFLNLFNNAIEAINQRWMQISNAETAAAQASPSITIRTQMLDEAWVMIAIRDTGIGITEDIQHQIYEPFFSTKKVGQGKGLGLTTSYRVITEVHQGELTFTTQKNQGTEFFIKLPINGLPKS